MERDPEIGNAKNLPRRHGDTEKKGWQVSLRLEKRLLRLLAHIQQHTDAGQHHEQA
jgi:hypothetical protein